MVFLLNKRGNKFVYLSTGPFSVDVSKSGDLDHQSLLLQTGKLRATCISGWMANPGQEVMGTCHDDSIHSQLLINLTPVKSGAVSFPFYRLGD
jgi:hypothetical protein